MNTCDTGLSASRIRTFTMVILGGMAFPVQAQTVSDRVTEYSASASIFTEVANTRTDVDSVVDSDTETSLGLAGSLGGNMQSGASALEALYTGNFRTTRDSSTKEYNENSFVTGVSRFTHIDPGSRFDFEAGHTVRTVRSEAGFLVDPTDYDTQNAIHAGGGVRFFPGDLSTLRLSGQAARTFEEESRNDSELLSAGAELSRRLSERSLGSVTGRRTRSEERIRKVTVDSAQLGYSYSLEHGLFAMGAGISQAETEFLAQDTFFESEAVTGYMSRSWASPESTTEVRYDRSLSSTALDLVFNFPEVGELTPGTVRFTDLSVEDSVMLTHSTTRICSNCDLAFLLGASLLESEETGATTHEYRSGLEFGIQITSLQRVNLGYSWAADAGKDADTLLAQIHQLRVGWSRRLTERTSVSVQASHAHSESRLGEPDKDRFVLRLALTHGIHVTGR